MALHVSLPRPWLARLGALFVLLALTSPVLAEDSFVGRWNSTFGPLEISQTSDGWKGRYPLGELTGTVDDGKLTFTYREGSIRGEGWFQLADGGESFAGKWRESSASRDGEWSIWVGTRDKPNFTGLWETSFGAMRLLQTGDQVVGVYTGGGGSSLEGSIGEGRLNVSFQTPTTSGDARFFLSADGQQFSGGWRETGDEHFQAWVGTRVKEEPGEVWLLILEAHWENSLVEKEYSFGDMLRSYLSMAQSNYVKIRHRNFHDLEDLHKFCREIPYIPGPVVLLVSSHGSPDGIAVGGDLIKSGEFASALRGATNLALVHLSGCSMRAGAFPQEVHEAFSPAERFPISGFTTIVDWGASAIADFTFLTMLFVRHLEVKEAIEQTHLAAPFTGNTTLPGSDLAPLGLGVLMPSGESVPKEIFVPAEEDCEPPEAENEEER